MQSFHEEPTDRPLWLQHYYDTVAAVITGAVQYVSNSMYLLGKIQQRNATRTNKANEGNVQGVAR